MSFDALSQYVCLGPFQMFACGSTTVLQLIKHQPHHFVGFAFKGLKIKFFLFKVTKEIFRRKVYFFATYIESTKPL